MDAAADLSAVLASLAPRTEPPSEVAAHLPREPGLVAWWCVSGALSACSSHLLTPDVRERTPIKEPVALAVGAATSLRNRVARQDLWRTGVSWPRRCLAGLLLDELALSPVWAAEVVLPRADEDRLSAWMETHVRLGWWVGEDRRDRLGPVTDALAPLWREGTEAAVAAEGRFVAAAGTRPRREPGVPYRRP